MGGSGRVKQDVDAVVTTSRCWRLRGSRGYTNVDDTRGSDGGFGRNIPRGLWCKGW